MFALKRLFNLKNVHFQRHYNIALITDINCDDIYYISFLEQPTNIKMGIRYIYINMRIHFVCLAASAFNVCIACPRHRYYGITCRGIHVFFFC